ncbi:hypothetical protein ASPBRDRAFT_656411 [Aspergillus brasiliensis CBS 101740]|uniref:Uncharacterized protein n=1 Tax=Aspergillus brasiliensis (strain CBS 101740 / IMI 381727 / IBT 21946) TaxID=767769 RepID=A0A1L9V2G4_ASPBC|nr:hypothetical protein ASPBRDRAFT_656411 [Aspergillus brasiliensis CBS 101740]
MGTSDTSVSVRECMLYYFKLAAGERSNWSLENEQQEPLQDWVIIKERDPSRRPNATTPTTYFPQLVHRIPSGASLGPPTPTTSKTMQLPQRPRNSGRGQSDSDSTEAKRVEYRDVGEVSIYGKFYKFTLDGKLSMKDRDQWTTDQDNENILYHHAEKLRGVFHGPAATPGALQGTDRKGKATVDIDGPATSSLTRNSQVIRHSQSQSRVPSNALPKTAAPKYTFIGVLPSGWKSYKHQEGDSSVDLPKAQWRKVGGYYYHDEKMLQGKAP